jgi:pimeloyl-ACP methyl ester carboxylesterase
MHMPTIDANGETLSYRVTGDGPALVLLHAVGAMSDLWADVISSLEDRFTVYAIDLRGHGASSLKGSLTTDDMARDLDAALGLLDLWPCHVVGSSLGAAVAVKLAANRPDKVRSLVVSGIGLSPDPVLSDEIYGIREAVHYLADDDFAYQVAEALLIPDAPQSSIDGLRDGILAQTKQNYLAGLEALEVADLTHIASKVTAPVLVLHGAMDELVPLERAEALAGALPAASVTQLADAGQIAYLDNAPGFSAALSTFLDAQKS